MKRLIILCLMMLLSGAALAQDSEELAKNPPVAILALSQGVCEIQSPGGDWRPAHWMTLVFPEDQLKTGDDGKLVVLYFHDDHREVVTAQTEAKTGFRSLQKLSEGGGEITVQRAQDRGVSEIPIPYLFLRRLDKKEFEAADEDGALERENTFLSSYVKSEAFPPVFVWSNTGSPSYKIQLFNEWDEFLYEKTVKETRYKYPYQPDFRLAKNSLYKWQVTDDQDGIVVRKYPFILLTTLHAREVEKAEKHYDNLEKAGKLTPADDTELFLLYVQRKMIDKYLHQLQKMSRKDPQNPVLYRGLVRAYLSKGCPAHARQALEQERDYGGVDELRD